MSVEIGISKAGDLDLPAVKALFKNCGWDWLADEEMQRAFQGSFRIFTVKVDGLLTGFARIVSDEKIYGLIVDLMIAPACREQGLGSQLVSAIEHQLKKDGVKIIQLLSSAIGKRLYLKAGFCQCPSESPGMMKLIAK